VLTPGGACTLYGYHVEAGWNEAVTPGLRVIQPPEKAHGLDYADYCSHPLRFCRGPATAEFPARRLAGVPELPPLATLPKPSIWDSLQERALGVCLTEASFWGCDVNSEYSESIQVPDYRVGDYLRGCVDDVTGAAEGPWLAASPGKWHFCAAAQGWSEARSRLSEDEAIPTWRSGALEIRNDAVRGKRTSWIPVDQVRDGWRPAPGCLAIYRRAGNAGHVDRVVEDLGSAALCIGANEGRHGRRWVIAPTRYDDPALLGFVDDEDEVERGVHADLAQLRDWLNGWLFGGV